MNNSEWELRQMQSLLFYGGSDVVNGDYSELKKASKDKTRTFKHWSSLKDAKRGDDLWFYITAPVSAIVATGVALSDAHPGKNWPYEATVGEVNWIENQISLNELRKMFPSWAWAKAARAKTHLTEQQAQALRKRLSEPAEQNPIKTIRRKSGAGYGDAEQNARVEVAAVNFVAKSYEAQGYEVRSVEADKCGYDLAAKRGKKELHLEVKGVSGDVPEFQITKNEVECARSDKAFRLVVVVNSLEKHRQAIELSGAQFLEKYELRPDSFRAVQKRQP